jgi:hypothetical protein
VRHVPDDDPDLLRYAEALGIVPGATITVLERSDGGRVEGIVVSVLSPLNRGEATHEVNAQAARHIFVGSGD